MIRKNFDDNWQFTKMQSTTLASSFSGSGMMQDSVRVDLPHDAMIYEERMPDTVNGAQTGFYPGGQYLYVKKLEVPKEWEKRTTSLFFGGIYQTAMVYVNGTFAGNSLHGYSEFEVCLDPYLHYGSINEIKVIADNTAVPNSRWYSGAGIYRNVELLQGGTVYIIADGVRLRTIAATKESAQIEIETKLCNRSSVKKKVLLRHILTRQGERILSDEVPVTLYPAETSIVRQMVCVVKPALWSCEYPALYQCDSVVALGNIICDENHEKFGIRTLSIDGHNGILLNGECVKLRGTCIHHDNGILGAAAFPEAEERKCRLLKQAGFNSIRSAHHPMGRAMLDACDRNGLMVMDELSDVWNLHKNPHDFALHFSQNWPHEVYQMVAKDYNHPSVILYSTGNEIQELGTEYGAHLNREISNEFHRLDSTRYTTTGLNGLMALAFNGKMSTVMQDLATKISAGKTVGNDEGSQAGANAINFIMGSIMGGEAADDFARHPILTESIAESEISTDVIGLNYLTGRHEMEKVIHPNKAVVGTETYPADIARLWQIVKVNPHMLGDFTWTGYDYLGEAGCGIFHYGGGVNFSSIWPERAAYIGDIDLVGNRRPISFYREIVYGLRDAPYLAVRRINRNGEKLNKTAWMFEDNIASWTWLGFEGKTAVVDVYSSAESVELFINGTSCGKKKVGEKQAYIATYELAYEPGKLEAVAYRDGLESGRFALQTAKGNTHITVVCDKSKLKADGNSLAFLDIGFEDDEGNKNLQEQDVITVTVEGAGNLLALGSANPASEERYDANTWPTFDGKLMAVIRGQSKSGEIEVSVKSQHHGEYKMNLEVLP